MIWLLVCLVLLFSCLRFGCWLVCLLVVLAWFCFADGFLVVWLFVALFVLLLVFCC